MIENYVEFEVGNETYKLVLRMEDILALEKKINGNPMSVFGMGERFPTVTEMCYVLWASLQCFHHGISVDKARGIFEGYLRSGNAQTDFLTVMMDVYAISGIIPKDAKEAEAKN